MHEDNMDITLRPIEPQDHVQVRQLLIDTGWEQRVSGQGRFERMIRGANRAIVALEDSRVVWGSDGRSSMTPPMATFRPWRLQQIDEGRVSAGGWCTNSWK